MRTVITAWETHSPLGRDADAHRRAAAAGTTDPGAGPRLVPDFDVRRALGPKGTRSMCRSAGLAVATTAKLLAQLKTSPDLVAGYPTEEIGVVIATSDQWQTLVDFNRDSWTRQRPYDVDPAQLPMLLMNFHAGQCAIWHQLRGPNATVTGSHLGSLLAINYARRLQRAGHARAVICGAVEECSAARSAYEAGPEEERRPPGEGCVLFLLEAAGAVTGGRRALAEVLAVEFGVFQPGGSVREALADCLRRVLVRAEVAPSQVVSAACSPSPGARGRAERAALGDVLGDVRIQQKTLAALGDTRAVAGAFQIVELVSEPGPRIAVVTASDDEGRVGCALLHTGGPR